MKIKRVIGEGSYGSVVICEKDGKDYALKTVKGDDFGLVSLQEIDIMNSVYNPFLCSASKTYIDGNSTLIFMDLASETLNKHNFQYDTELRMAAFQMVCSLAFLEKRSIIHGDIKSNNFLCFSHAYGIDLNVRLTDFSLSCRSYGQGSSPLFKMFCSIYRPLEAWFGEAECKSDVWALGCCLYELYTGEHQLFPTQDEKHDGKIYDLVDGSKVQKRWRFSNDLYLNTLEKFADQTNQRISPQYRSRLESSSRRVRQFSGDVRMYVRDWRKIYRGLPDFIRDMLIVDPSLRPSASELFHSDYFSVERESLTLKLSEYYELSRVPHSDGSLVLLDGAVRHHLSRNPLEHEEIEYFMSREYYERVTRIVALDIFSKCKHISDSPHIIRGCLLISIKLTDPSKIEWFEYDRYEEREHRQEHEEDTIDPDEELEEILRAEQLICQTLNYVLYPETSMLFNLTDEQVRAFFI
jgi:serine/threonine protein kinase